MVQKNALNKVTIVLLGRVGQAHTIVLGSNAVSSGGVKVVTVWE